MVCEVIKPLDVIVCGDLLDDGLKPGPGLGVLDVYFIPDLVVVTLRLNNLLYLHLLLLDDLLAGGLLLLRDIVSLGNTQRHLL